MYLGRALHTKETLPDFREKCRVNQHSRVFPRVDGYLTDPRDLGRDSTLPSFFGSIMYVSGPDQAFHLGGLGLGEEPLRYVPRLPIQSLGILIRSRQGLPPRCQRLERMRFPELLTCV